MDRLDNLAYTGICNYFKALSRFGYKRYSEVNKLLLLFFIEDLLRSQFSLYINENDYRTITNTLYTLFGPTCLIPYPELKDNSSLVQMLNADTTRISEYDTIRFSENEFIRLLNK